MPLVQVPNKLVFTTLMFLCPIIIMFFYILNMKLDLRDLKIEYLTYQLTTVLQLPDNVPEHVDNTAENYIRSIFDKVILVVLSSCIFMIVTCIEFAVKKRSVVAQQGHHFAETQLSMVNGAIEQLTLQNDVARNLIDSKDPSNDDDSGLGLISLLEPSDSFTDLDLVMRQMRHLPIATECTESHPFDTYLECCIKSNIQYLPNKGKMTK